MDGVAITIVIDLLALGYGGSETYAREMLPRLAASGHEFIVLLRQGSGEVLRGAPPPQVQVVDAPAGTASPLGRFLYQRREVPRLMRELGARVLYVPSGHTGTPSRPDFKLVSMLQNMLPFEARERARYWLSGYPRMRLRLWLLRHAFYGTLRRADRVIFISEYSASIVRPLLPGVDSRVIPHGVPQTFADKEPLDPKLPERYGLRKPYFLYVSILDPYKHQHVVVEGFERFCRAASQGRYQLALAGPIVGPYGAMVQRAAARCRGAVLCLGAVPPSDLPGLVRQAEILLFASTCENCPIVLLEYLGCGRPIICSRKQPMPEFAGDAAAYVDALDPEAWATELSRLTAAPNLMPQMAARARERARLYSWDETVRKTVAALTEWQ